MFRQELSANGDIMLDRIPENKRNLIHIQRICLAAQTLREHPVKCLRQRKLLLHRQPVISDLKRVIWFLSIRDQPPTDRKILWIIWEKLNGCPVAVIVGQVKRLQSYRSESSCKLSSGLDRQLFR